MFLGRVQLLLLLAAQSAVADPSFQGLRGLSEASKEGLPAVQKNNSNADQQEPQKNKSVVSVSIVPIEAQKNKSTVNVSVVRFSHLTGEIIGSDHREALMLTTNDIDIYNGLRGLVIKFIGFIPEVGKWIAALVDFFWPKEKTSIWDQIKDKVQAMVSSATLKLELQQRQADLQAYQITLGRYAAAKDKERKGFLSDLITEGDDIYAKLTSSNVKQQILPVTVAFSLLHLGVLAERYNHGKLIIGEDNSAVWLKELKQLHEEYSTFFVTQYDAWYKFRFAQIDISWPRIQRPSALPPFFYQCATGKAHDKLTGASIGYEVDFMDSDTYFKSTMESIREMWMNRAVADMAAAMSPFFLSHRMIPGRENEAPQVFPKLQVLWMGPYSVTTLGVSHSNMGFTPDINDVPGNVTSWTVREYNSVDYQQLKFVGRDGKGVGNIDGGAPHHVSPPKGGHFIGSTMLWANGILVSIDLQFSDGTSTGTLGNRGGWGGARVSDIVGGGMYQLDAGAYSMGYGPSSTTGTGLLKHRFSIPDASWNGTKAYVWPEQAFVGLVQLLVNSTGVASHSQVSSQVPGLLLGLGLVKMLASL